MVYDELFESSMKNPLNARFSNIRTVFTGHVNVIGLSMQPSVPQISVTDLKPHLMNQSSVDFSSLQMHLQPRRPTTGNVDFLQPPFLPLQQLQPKLLLGMFLVKLF